MVCDLIERGSHHPLLLLVERLNANLCARGLRHTGTRRTPSTDGTTRKLLRKSKRIIVKRITARHTPNRRPGGSRYFFLCRFFLSFFLRLCVAILWRLRFRPHGMQQLLP